MWNIVLWSMTCFFFHRDESLVVYHEYSSASEFQPRKSSHDGSCRFHIILGHPDVLSIVSSFIDTSVCCLSVRVLKALRSKTVSANSTPFTLAVVLILFRNDKQILGTCSALRVSLIHQTIRRIATLKYCEQTSKLYPMATST